MRCHPSQILLLYYIDRMMLLHVAVINFVHILSFGWETSSMQSETSHTDIQGSIQICSTVVWLKALNCMQEATLQRTWIFVEEGHKEIDIFG